MAITALDIQQQSFATARHGYDPTEVDIFLERLAGEVDTYNRALSEAQVRLKAADEKLIELKNQATVEPTRTPSSSSVSEDVISKAFIAAQKSADALKEEARKEAEKLYRDADAQARDIVRDALTEKQSIIAEIDRLRESSEKFRTEYLSLIAHFQADAQQRLAGINQIAPTGADIKSEQQSLGDLLKRNDAAVEAPRQQPNTIPGETAVFTTAQATSAATAKSPGNTGFFANTDDDLDIEEID